MSDLSPTDVASVIDHTYLQSEAEGVTLATQSQMVSQLVSEAIEYGAYSVCVRSWMVAHARRLLNSAGASVKVCSVIGFPVGDDFSFEQKLDELKLALDEGADEIDMVMAVNRFKTDKQACCDEIGLLSEHTKERVLKVIIENAYLLTEQKREVWQAVFDVLAAESHLARRFLKTSTGFAKPPPGVAIGATIEDVSGMHTVTKGRCGIKPAGGIKNLDDARQFFSAAGSPTRIDGDIDPYRFRIGSSSLLTQLFQGRQSTGGGAY